MIEIKIENVSFIKNNEISLELLLSDGVHGEKKAFIVPEAQVRNMNLHADMVLSEEEYELLEHAAAFRGALRKGVDLLSYGANSQTALQRKLIRRGYATNVAARAAEYLAQKGYINESANIEAIIDSSIKKGYGSRRITAKLREKGYGDAAIEEAAELLCEYDFSELCAVLIQKRCGGGRIPKERETRDRIIAAMTRYGYNLSEIRDAILRLDEMAE